jgi:hypothetical protein
MRRRTPYVPAAGETLRGLPHARPGGAIAALLSAKKAGKLRYIGFTGHKGPESLNHMLDVAKDHGVRFDTVQLPLNVMDPHFQSFEAHTLPRLVRDDLGVLGMKPFGAGKILLSGVVSAVECLRYTLSLPTSVVITGCESQGILEQALAIGIGFTPLSDGEKQELLERTRPPRRRRQVRGLQDHPRARRHDPEPALDDRSAALSFVASRLSIRAPALWLGLGTPGVYVRSPRSDWNPNPLNGALLKGSTKAMWAAHRRSRSAPTGPGSSAI